MKIPPQFLLALFLSVAGSITLTAPAAEISDERIEAQVNRAILTSSELARILRPIYRQYEEAISGQQLLERKQKARENAIASWIEKQLILQEAEALKGLRIDPLEVEGEFQEAKNRFSSPEEFEKTLRREGLTEKEFRKTLQDGLKVKILTYKEVTSKTMVSPQEVITYYQNHSTEFSDPARVRVSHILIPLSEEMAGENTALATAQMVLAKLDAGEDFAALARQYSHGPHADQGGDLGYFEPGQMLPKLDETAFSLPVNQPSPIIETDLGYHIIKVTAKKSERRRTLEEVYDKIEDQLFQEKFQERYDKWIEKLKAKAFVVIEQ